MLLHPCFILTMALEYMKIWQGRLLSVVALPSPDHIKTPVTAETRSENNETYAEFCPGLVKEFFAGSAKDTRILFTSPVFIYYAVFYFVRRKESEIKKTN